MSTKIQKCSLQICDVFYVLGSTHENNGGPLLSNSFFDSSQKKRLENRKAAKNPHIIQIYGFIAIQENKLTPFQVIKTLYNSIKQCKKT